jgi:hypothetical protein
MDWDFGAEIDLAIDEEKREVLLKTLKVSVPDEYEIDHLRQIEEVDGRLRGFTGGYR